MRALPVLLALVGIVVACKRGDGSVSCTTFSSKDGIVDWSECSDNQSRTVACFGPPEPGRAFGLATEGPPDTVLDCKCEIHGSHTTKFTLVRGDAHFETRAQAAAIVNPKCGWNMSSQ